MRSYLHVCTDIVNALLFAINTCTCRSAMAVLFIVHNENCKLAYFWELSAVPVKLLSVGGPRRAELRAEKKTDLPSAFFSALCLLP